MSRPWFVRTMSVALLFLTGTIVARAQAPLRFEMFAVADKPGPHTREYLGVTNGPDGKADRMLLTEPALLDSSVVRLVTLDYDADQKAYILISLTPAGTKRLEQATRNLIGKQVGMVIGGQIYAVPRIGEPIHGGKIAISGNFTPREAAHLVERLNAALPPTLPEQR